ncbi:MAG: toxin-antitoxin system HicB family antitoxin [Alphaproteobacteria bacterium]|nr:toxin-antitoxin system HicB family antitoxin [Alphaproteobacteria bacterium]MCB9699410.1 toxin-antitoxin system HicB family antitoxin [Alphaproteobacteria bacterium]
MAQLTIRTDDPELHDRLKALAAERGVSLNALVVELLARAVDVDARKRRLRRYATWTEEDLEVFESAVRREILPGDWR